MINIVPLRARRDPNQTFALPPKLRALQFESSTIWPAATRPRRNSWATNRAATAVTSSTKPLTAAPEHGLFRHISLDDATWHRHGTLAVPEGAVSLIDAVEGGSVLYDDSSSGPGRRIVSTLDPCYHHGSYFMPSTTRFLHGFLPWLKQGAAAD